MNGVQRRRKRKAKITLPCAYIRPSQLIATAVEMEIENPATGEWECLVRRRRGSRWRSA